MMITQGDALDLISSFEEKPFLIATDPPYAFGADAKEHALSATVAVVLREAAKRLQRGGWMLTMSASSWRSMAYMVESVRGIVEPVRVATWTKPEARSKTRTPGWLWASVSVIAFRKGKSEDLISSNLLDHIEAPIVTDGRRAQLPPAVADWVVQPYAKAGALMLDPFAGSGALCLAAERAGMRAIGFEKDVTPEEDSSKHQIAEK
jgi:DNA modification methylase